MADGKAGKETIEDKAEGETRRKIMKQYENRKRMTTENDEDRGR